MIGFVVLASLALAQQAPMPYRDAALSIDDRVKDLLSRMTLEEKIAQITGGRRADRGIVDTTGRFPQEKADEAMREMYQLDSHMSPRDRAVLQNALQRYLVEKTRLGIPAIYTGEALHGFMAYGSTSFPQALALASTWDPELQRQVFT